MTDTVTFVNNIHFGQLWTNFSNMYPVYNVQSQRLKQTQEVVMHILLITSFHIASYCNCKKIMVIIIIIDAKLQCSNFKQSL